MLNMCPDPYSVARPGFEMVSHLILRPETTELCLERTCHCDRCDYVVALCSPDTLNACNFVSF